MNFFVYNKKTGIIGVFGQSTITSLSELQVGNDEIAVEGIANGAMQHIVDGKLVDFTEVEMEQRRQRFIPSKAESEKAIRNSLLTESDWTQLPDVALSAKKKEEWRVYRQALRNMNIAAVKPGA